MSAVSPGDKNRWLSRYPRGMNIMESYAASVGELSPDADDPYFGHPFDVVRAIRDELSHTTFRTDVDCETALGGHRLTVYLTTSHDANKYILAEKALDLLYFENPDNYSHFGYPIARRYEDLNRQYTSLFSRGEFFDRCVEYAESTLVRPIVDWARDTHVNVAGFRASVTKLLADEDRVRAEIAAVQPELAKIINQIRSHTAEVDSDDGLDLETQRELHELASAFAAKQHRVVTAISAGPRVLAPGAAGALLTDPVALDHSATPPAYVRFGTTAPDVPAIAPFLSRAGWFVTGDAQRRSELVGDVLLRTILQVPPDSLKIRSFDPLFSGGLGVFAPLAGVPAAHYDEPAHEPDGLRRILAEATSDLSAASALLGGRNLTSVRELWANDAKPSLPFVVIVVLDYPSGIDEPLQNTLLRLAQSGAARGVTLLIDHNPGVSPAHGVVPQDLIRHLVSFQATSRGWLCSTMPEAVVVDFDTPAPWPVRQKLVQRVVDTALATPPAAILLQDLVRHFHRSPWSDTADDGVEALIGVSIGGGNEPAALSLRSENPPHSNLLVGGAVGQGKSNLLLAIIYALALRYPPKEVEMLLIDFKHGLEFQRLAPDVNGQNWLPHASVVCLQSDKLLGVSILKHVFDVLTARADMFLKARVNSFAAYRRTTGQDLARMLVVIDEFQVLFDGNDDVSREAIGLVEKLARQGRAYGIHLILSSQTLSGISSLAMKSDSIFAQFALRLSFKNTADESQTILGRGNTAAAAVTRPGEVVINRDYGNPAANEGVMTGLVDGDFAAEVQQQLWSLDDHQREPIVFLGQNFAPWPIHRPDDYVDTALVGRPLAVNGDVVGFEFHRDTAQAVAVLGTATSEASAVLAAMIATLTATWSDDDVVTVLDARPGRAGADDILTGCLERARSRGISVEVHTETAAIAHYLVSTVSPQTARRTLIVALQLQRVDALSEEFLVDPQNPYGDRISGAGVLKNLVERGSVSGTHVIGWWPNVRALQMNLGYDNAGLRRYVFANAAAGDIRQLAGVTAPTSAAPPRVIVFDPDRGEDVTITVPFDPWDTRRA